MSRKITKKFVISFLKTKGLGYQAWLRISNTLRTQLIKNIQDDTTTESEIQAYSLMWRFGTRQWPKAVSPSRHQSHRNTARGLRPLAS